MWKYQETDELYHYGIIGMKWGMRRARKSNMSYTYRSHGQKKYAARLNKLQTNNKANPSAKLGKKIAKTQNKLNMYKQRDANRQEYASKTGVGRSVAKTVLFGPLGAGNYNRFRASGHGRIVSAIGANAITSTLGYPVTLAVSKSSENRMAKRDLKRMNNSTKK